MNENAAQYAKAETEVAESHDDLLSEFLLTIKRQACITQLSKTHHIVIPPLERLEPVIFEEVMTPVDE